jgi:hypothetical protein
MQQLLHKCLEVHSTTILPEFGAIMKLGNNFVYNEYLKFDDGKLIDFVSGQQNCSKEEAKQQVSTWIADLKEKLSKGDSIRIENVGVLVKEDDKIQLKKIDQDSKPTEVVTPVVEIKVEEPRKIQFEVPVHSEPEEIEPIKEELIEETITDSNTSSGLSAKMAIASIESFTDKNKLIEYTRGENRKTVVDALNKKLNQLNGKTTSTPEVKIEEPPVETPNSIEIIEPVENTNQSVDVVETIENTKEIEELLALTENLDKVEPQSNQQKVPVVEPIKEEPKTEEPVKTVTPQIEKTPEPAPKVSNKEEDKALEVIAAGVVKLEKEQKKRKIRRIILFSALICLLAGGGILGYLKKDYLLEWYNGQTASTQTDSAKDESQKVNANETTTEPEPIADVVEAIDTSAQETVIEEPIAEVVPEVEEPKKEPKTTTPKYTEPASASGNFLLVAGTFSKETNASTLVEKLKSEGFGSASMTPLSGGMYRVTAGSYDSKDAAENAKNELVAKGMKGYVQKK